MFTIIYQKDSGDIVQIISGEANEQDLLYAIGGEESDRSFIKVEELPQIKEYGQKLCVVDKELKVLDVELTTQDLRDIRRFECFDVLNQYSPFWYEELGEERYQELKSWYQDWLDVTETKVIPERPTWIK